MVKPFVLADTGNLDVEDDMRKGAFNTISRTFISIVHFRVKLVLSRQNHCMRTNSNSGIFAEVCFL
jgi:hypothetical protein